MLQSPRHSSGVAAELRALNQAFATARYSPTGAITDANPHFARLTGYRRDELVGRGAALFAPDSDARQQSLGLWEALRAGETREETARFITKSGHEIWLHSRYIPLADAAGAVVEIVQIASAATERQTDLQSQIDAIDRSTSIAVFALDGTILDANENFRTMIGYPLEELQGEHHSMLVERHAVTSKEYDAFWETLRSGAYHSGMYKRLGKDGREIWIQASYNPVLGPSGKPTKVIKYAVDVTSNVALAEAFEDAKRQAHHDSATSLPNRVKLSAFLEANLAGPAGNMVVFYIDLDRFKALNDVYGHQVGDRVLAELADRMRRLLRDDQMIARVGGDEFVIAAPGMPADAIERFCKHLFETVTAPIHHEGQEIITGISMGIATAPADGASPDEILRAADAALDRSKQNGRNQYTFYATEMNARSAAQRRLAEDLRQGLSAGQFFLEYQPRFDTESGRIRSAEALIRWAHPERGRVSPGEFIFLAERNGLIVPLGDWIMRTACKTAAGWGGIGISVNVSPAQFRDPTLIDKVKHSLHDSGLPGHLLELEITEGVLVDDASRAARILNELKSLGVKLALDDFGTGYSSLSYLRNFPFDVIKIDRSFIHDLDSGPSARSIIQAIVSLGKALGLTVTAEGVETEAQHATLAADGCNEVQGFLLARPMGSEQVQGLINQTQNAKVHAIRA